MYLKQQLNPGWKNSENFSKDNNRSTFEIKMKVGVSSRNYERVS